DVCSSDLRAWPHSSNRTAQLILKEELSMTFKHSLLRSVQFVVLTALFLAFYIGGAMLVASSLPPMSLAEPGPIPSPWDLVLVGAAHTLVIMLIILWSRWRGW